MLPSIGHFELILVLLIAVMLFGAGKLPVVFGAVGKGFREFRQNAADSHKSKTGEEPAAV